jgi:hypothetical protein
MEHAIHVQQSNKIMAEFQIPTCDHDHDQTPMTKVWADGHGNAVYQCPVCGRKIQCHDGAGGR